ncbi:hypothetical protein ES708_27005 [subsurface metagenome]
MGMSVNPINPNVKSILNPAVSIGRIAALNDRIVRIRRTMITSPERGKIVSESLLMIRFWLRTLYGVPSWKIRSKFASYCAIISSMLSLITVEKFGTSDRESIYRLIAITVPSSEIRFPTSMSLLRAFSLTCSASSIVSGVQSTRGPEFKKPSTLLILLTEKMLSTLVTPSSSSRS